MNKSLLIDDLYAGVKDKMILRGVSLMIKPGEVHALMGPNGSGKSTLASVLMGKEEYVLSEKEKNRKTKLLLNGVDLLKLSVDDRARKGLFMAFQLPVDIPGVSVVNFLRMAYKQVHPEDKQMKALAFFKYLQKLAGDLDFNPDLIKRALNDGLSGGERKKMECLQLLVLKPKYILLDEIDTGTDVDALRVIGSTIRDLIKSPNPPGVLLITHYNRIFKYVKPDFVHILKDGRIVKSGSYKLAKQVEKEGYGEL